MDISSEQIYVHAGTQTGSILGFNGTITSMQNVYAYAPHQGSVKCVGSSGRFLITGGFDEIIRLYDLKQRKERGQLIGHEGTITCLRSYKNFLISGAEDSMIIIWKAAKEWSLLFRLKGHKDSVYDLALHDSGKLLASVGKDRKIILWNMINGGKIFRKTMPFNTYKVKWAPGENLLIMSDKVIHLVSQEDNKSMKEFVHPKQINDFIVLGSIMIVAGDDGNLYFWNNIFEVEQQSFYLTFKAHTPRVKKIKHLKIAGKDILISCSTDGTICTWEIDEILNNIGDIAESKVLEEDLKPLYSLFSYQRIISLDVHFANQVIDPLQQPGAQGVAQEVEENEEQAAKKAAIAAEKKVKKDAKRQAKKAALAKTNAAGKHGKKIKKVQFVEPEEKKGKKQVHNDKKKTFDKEKVRRNQQKYQEKAEAQKKTFGKHGKQAGGKFSKKDLSGKGKGQGQGKKKFGQKLEVEYDN